MQSFCSGWKMHLRRARLQLHRKHTSVCSVQFSRVKGKQETHCYGYYLHLACLTKSNAKYKEAVSIEKNSPLSGFKFRYIHFWWVQSSESRISVSKKCAESRSYRKKKSTSGVQYPNISADPLHVSSVYENGSSSRVAHYQETSVKKERQERKSEPEREITEAPPQSLAFS